MQNFEENKPARTLSPELRQECDNDSLFSDELKNIVIAHEIYVICIREKSVKKVIRRNYETSKGSISIYSLFTDEGKFRYSHTKFLHKSSWNNP